MNPIYRVFRRNNRYYKRDTRTGKRTSLKTTNREEAQRLVDAENQAHSDSVLGQRLAQAYLNASDPKAFGRTWKDVMDEVGKVGIEATRERKQRVFKSREFDTIRDKPLLTTQPEDFFTVLSTEKVTVKTYLVQLQNCAVDLGWIPKPVVPKRRLPKIVASKKARAITSEEHLKVIESEKNEEQQLYYKLLWETGASQSDAALLTDENIDWERNILCFERAKTGQMCLMTMSNELRCITKQLPMSGLLFPKIAQGDWRYRSAEFRRRCRLLGIEGCTLHSYRYAWAQRAVEAGIPERFAMAALGHGSKAVHRAYAKSAEAVCPALPST